jgi:2-phosphosulfolactate phosphatase
MSNNDNIAEVLTLFTPSELVGIDLRGSVAIVIDILRGSSTVIYALKNGAARIIPVAEIEEAREMADNWPTGELILCAERNAVKVTGFDLGNSPFEYAPEIVDGKNLIYSSTNCSKALLSSYGADRVLIGAFNNISAVLSTIGPASRVFLVCSGKMGRFALEDAVCAGMFVNEFLKDTSHSVALNDASRTAKLLFDFHHRDLLSMLKESSHGSYLIHLGAENDLELASQVDSVRIVPELSLDKSYIFATYIPTPIEAASQVVQTSKEPIYRTTSIAVDPELYKIDTGKLDIEE